MLGEAILSILNAGNPSGGRHIRRPRWSAYSAPQTSTWWEERSRDVFEDNTVEAKAKAKARSFWIKATYTYKSYMTSEAP